MTVAETTPGALKGYRVVDAHVPVQFGSIRLVRDRFDEPVDLVSQPERSHVLTLTTLPFPGTALGSFPDLWTGKRSAAVGELFLLPAGYVVQIKSRCRAQSSIVCRFNPESAHRWFEHDLDWTDCRLKAALDINSPRIRHLLCSIAEEIRAPGFASEIMIELMAAQAVIEVSRYLKMIDQEKPVGGLSKHNLELIDQRIRESPKAPSLVELAELCGLSCRHLARAFRVSKKQSLGSYISQHRIELAKRRLATGESIKRVAYALGFSAPSNFTTAFRRATGETPREYQLKNRIRSIAAPERR